MFLLSFFSAIKQNSCNQTLLSKFVAYIVNVLCSGGSFVFSLIVINFWNE